MTFVWRLAVTMPLYSGPIPEELGGLSQLYELQLSNNKFTGEAGSVEFLLLQRLFWVLLYNKHRLTNLLQPLLQPQPSLSNHLTGEIPESLGQLAKLREFHLSKNQLTGESLRYERCVYHTHARNDLVSHSVFLGDCVERVVGYTSGLRSFSCPAEPLRACSVPQASTGVLTG